MESDRVPGIQPPPTSASLPEFLSHVTQEDVLVVKRFEMRFTNLQIGRFPLTQVLFWQLWQSYCVINSVSEQKYLSLWAYFRIKPVWSWNETLTSQLHASAEDAHLPSCSSSLPSDARCPWPVEVASWPSNMGGKPIWKHCSKSYRKIKTKSEDLLFILSEKYLIGSGTLHWGSDSQYISLFLKKLWSYSQVFLKNQSE